MSAIDPRFPAARSGGAPRTPWVHVAQAAAALAAGMGVGIALRLLAGLTGALVFVIAAGSLLGHLHQPEVRRPAAHQHSPVLTTAPAARSGRG